MPHGTSLLTLVDVHTPRVPINAQMSAGQLTSGISTVVRFPTSLVGLTAWYDASQIAGITSGTSLSAWTDMSGNGNHITQASAQSQPTYQTNAQNGLPVVQFPLNAATVNSFLQGTFTLNQPETIAIAFSYSTSTGIGSRAVFDGKTNISMFLDNSTANLPATGTQRIFAGTVLDEVASRITGGSFYVMAGVFNGSTSTFVVSNSFVTAGAVGAANAGGFTLANRGTPSTSNALPIAVGEVVIYNAALSPADLTSLGSYLIAKWGATT
jgi:trimeric autotransporter adhesin